MTTKTYILFNLCLLELVRSLNRSIKLTFVNMGVFLIFTILPDIDIKGSLADYLFRPVARIVQKYTVHRTTTHSILFMGILGLFSLIWSSYSIFVFLGYFGHIFADTLTKTGVPLLYPSRLKFVFPRDSYYRIKTGGKSEWKFFALLVCLLACLHPLGQTGFRRSIRNLFGTMKAAHKDYIEAETDCFAQVEIINNTTKTKQKLKVFVLKCNSSALLGYNKRFYYVSNSGEYTGLSIRIERTNFAPKIRQIEFEGTWEELQKQTSENEFLCGKITAKTNSFEVLQEYNKFYKHIEKFGNTIQIDFANKSELEKVQVRAVGFSRLQFKGVLIEKVIDTNFI